MKIEKIVNKYLEPKWIGGEKYMILTTNIKTLLEEIEKELPTHKDLKTQVIELAESLPTFMFTQQMKTGDMNIRPEERYFIVSANINTDDPFVWKYNVREHNFTMIFSEEYGDSSILGKDLPEAMKMANDWAQGLIDMDKEKVPSDRLYPVLFITKIS